MSHSCPECGMACYCSGDIEDHDTGEEYTDRCTCCADCEDEEPDDWDLRDWQVPDVLKEPGKGTP
jgi:hypothetical protein